MAAPNFGAVTYRRQNPLPDGVELRLPPRTTDEETENPSFMFPLSIQSLAGAINRAFENGGSDDLCHITYNDEGYEAGQVDIDGRARKFANATQPPTDYYTVYEGKILYLSSSSINTIPKKRSSESAAEPERKRVRTTAASPSHPHFLHRSLQKSHRTWPANAPSPSLRPSSLTRGFSSWRRLNPPRPLPRAEQITGHSQSHPPVSPDLNRCEIESSRAKQKQMATLPRPNGKRPRLPESSDPKFSPIADLPAQKYERKRSRSPSNRQHFRKASKDLDAVTPISAKQDDKKQPRLGSRPSSSAVAETQFREPASRRNLPPTMHRSRPAQKTASELDLRKRKTTSGTRPNARSSTSPREPLKPILRSRPAPNAVSDLGVKKPIFLEPSSKAKSPNSQRSPSRPMLRSRPAPKTTSELGSQKRGSRARASQNPGSSTSHGNLLKPILRSRPAPSATRETDERKPNSRAVSFTTVDASKNPSRPMLRSHPATNTTAEVQQHNSTSPGNRAKENQLTLRTVSKRSSERVIEEALKEFDDTVQRTDPIRTNEEENAVRNYWEPLHALYTEVNNRLERMVSEVEELGKSHEKTVDRAMKRKLEKDIMALTNKNSQAHKLYVKYLPVLHKEVKKTVERLEEWIEFESSD